MRPGSIELPQAFAVHQVRLLPQYLQLMLAQMELLGHPVRWEPMEHLVLLERQNYQVRKELPVHSVLPAPMVQRARKARRVRREQSEQLVRLARLARLVPLQRVPQERRVLLEHRAY